MLACAEVSLNRTLCKHLFMSSLLLFIICPLVSLAMAVFSAKNSGQLLPRKFAPSYLWLLPSAPLLPHILGEGGGVCLGLVAQVTLKA